jgi:hypothetical protein
MNSQKIEDIRSQFKHEWLLIAVDQMDELTSTPLTGRLIAHSPDSMEIHKVAMQHKELLATLYSDDWPEDLAATGGIFQMVQKNTVVGVI